MSESEQSIKTEVEVKGVIHRDLSTEVKESGKSQDILDFWFAGNGSGTDFCVEMAQEDLDKWFLNSKQFDGVIEEKFGELLDEGLNGNLDHWIEEGPKGGLALVILLDQFSRQVHRGTAQAFAYDAKALEVARKVIEGGFPEEFNMFEVGFCLLPFEHSEDAAVHEEAVVLMKQLADKATEQGGSCDIFLEYELEHKKTIDKFGRYPHRNEVLGRESTPEEKEYLETANRYGQ